MFKKIITYILFCGWQVLDKRAPGCQIYFIYRNFFVTGIMAGEGKGNNKKASLNDWAFAYNHVQGGNNNGEGVHVRHNVVLQEARHFCIDISCRF